MWLELEERGTSVHTGEGSTSSLQPCKEASSCREPKSLPLFTQKITAPNAPHHHRDEGVEGCEYYGYNADGIVSGDIVGDTHGACSTRPRPM